MTMEDKVAIDILGRHFKIKCPADKVTELQQAAAFVVEMMDDIRQQGVSSPDRIAIMTALNIAHELLLLREQKDQQVRNMGERLHKLQQRIEQALVQNEQLELE